MQTDSELTIHHGGEETTVPLVRQFLLGSRRDADVVLEEAGAAPTHLVINPSRSGALLIVLDQEGGLPVRVGGVQVLEPQRLRHGDVVEAGPVRLVYHSGAGERTASGRLVAGEGPPVGTSSSALESQRWSWLVSEAPSAEAQVARTLYRLANLAATAPSEADLLEGALSLAVQGAGAQQGAVFARASEQIVPVATLGVPEDEAGFDRACLERALDEGLATTLGGEVPSLYVPIAGADRVPEGAVCLRRAAGSRPFGEAELQLLASVGRLLSVAQERVELIKELQTRSLALSQLQRRFETALGAIAEGLLLVYSDGTLEPLNGKGAVLVQELLEGHQGESRLPGDTALGAMVGEVQAGGGPVRRTLGVARQAFEASVSRVEGLDAVVVVLRDVTWKQQVEEAHRHAQEELREEILQVSSREQRRIGQALHDGLCQQLVGISLLAQGLVARTSGTPGELIATEIVNLLSQAAEDTRRLAKGLCPVALETSGLGSALEELAGSFEKMYADVACTVTREREVLGPRDPVATHLYHIAQEALSNAVKHGQATHVAITLGEPDGEILLEIENDGAPFVEPTSTGGMGLRTMRYRAQMLGAELTIVPREGGGSRVACRLAREGET